MNEQISEKHIVNKKPKEYLKQGKVHCGVYTAKAVLEAYGKGKYKDPKEYHVSTFNKITGSMFVSQDLVDVFLKHGLKTRAIYLDKVNDQERLYTIKKLLLKNKPIPVFVGNGYNYDEGNIKYSALKSLLVGHIISIWVYDDLEQVFYIYDSCVPKNHYSKNIPIGNIKRSYKDFLRDWKGAFHRRWTRPYTYLEILE